MKQTDKTNGNRRSKIISAILAVMFCFGAVIGTLAAVGATSINDNDVFAASLNEDAITSKAVTALTDNSAAIDMTDEELSLTGTVLDESGLSLMPDNFSFVDYKETPKPTETTAPSATKENKNDDSKETSKPSSTPSKTDGYSIDDYAKLKPGMTSDAVKSLQQRLMDLDYLSNDEPTNYYGTQTAYAVQLFQYRNDLTPNGICNAQTAKLLFSSGAKKYKVSIGVSGTDVTEIQKRLKELGYLKSSITGYFGTDTDAAVRAFQKNNGLAVDGQVGSATREALYSSNAKPATSGGGSSTTNPTPTKKPDQPSKTDPPSSSNPAPDTAAVAKFIAAAKTHLGAPYVWGGKGPDSFDCSGFVYYVINKDMGRNFYYMTSAGWAASSYPTISKANLQAGDILCFEGHVGIYLGNGSMIDASSSEGKIRIAYNIWSSSYWNSHFLYGKRYFTK